MPAKKKSQTKSPKAKAKSKSSKVVKTMAESTASMAPTTSQPMSMPRLNSKFYRYGLLLILIALLTYKFGPWLFPARVGYTPISRFQIWSQMEKSYGQQTLDDIVNEKVLDAALAKSGVTVEDSKVQDQIKSLEDQFASIGGLDEALKQRGLTRTSLEKQIKTQLKVEQILADKIEPSEEAIKKEFDDNKATLYKDAKFEDVKDSIVKKLKDANLRDAFLTWFSDVKKDIPVTNFGL